MVLINAQDRLLTIVDIKIGGQSVIAAVRAAMLVTGRLEDADDAITVLPGERLELDQAETVLWIEE